MPKGTRGDFGALAGNRRQPWQSPRELSTQRQLGSSRDWSSPDCKGCAKNRHLSAGRPVQAQLPAKSRGKGDGKAEDDSRDCVTPSFAKLTSLPAALRPELLAHPMLGLTSPGLETVLCPHILPGVPAFFRRLLPRSETVLCPHFTVPLHPPFAVLSVLWPPQSSG